MRWYALLLLSLLMASCSTSNHTSACRSAYELRHKADTLQRVDSIYIHDSVAVMMRGDTIHKYKERVTYRDRWKFVVNTDTFLRIDTVMTTKYVYDKSAQEESKRLKLLIAAAI